MSIDRRLDQLETALRQLGVEYEIFFSNGRRQPPNDLAARVEGMLRALSQENLAYAQHFRLSQLQQRHRVMSQAWRRRVGIREDGFRRPADRLLSVAATDSASSPRDLSQTVALIADTAIDQASMERLYATFLRLRERSVNAPKAGTLRSFASFLQTRAQQIRATEGVEQVEASVTLEDGTVRLRLRARKTES